MEEEGVDALLVTHLPDVAYLCGFTGSNAALAVTARRAVMYTDGRYTAQAKEQVNAARAVIAKKSALLEALALLVDGGASTVSFDGMQRPSLHCIPCANPCRRVSGRKPSSR